MSLYGFTSVSWHDVQKLSYSLSLTFFDDTIKAKKNFCCLQYITNIKIVVRKYLTHFCYSIKQVLHQYLNSLVAYPGIPPENSNHT